MAYIRDFMKETKKESFLKKEKSNDKNEEIIPFSELNTPLVKQEEEKLHSPNLSVCVSSHLLNLMKEVTKNEITPATINAACNCAQVIYKFVSLNVNLKNV